MVLLFGFPTFFLRRRCLYHMRSCARSEESSPKIFQQHQNACGHRRGPKPDKLCSITWFRSCKEMRGKILRTGERRTQQLHKVATPCVDDHQLKQEEIGSVGELSRVCSQIVLKVLYLARIGRVDISWSVNELVRALTKWTRACDKRSARLISHFHHTCEFKQYCHVGNTAQQCRLGLFSRF